MCACLAALAKGGVEMTPMVEAVEAAWRLQKEPKEVKELIWEWQKFRVSARRFLEEVSGEGGGEGGVGGCGGGNEEVAEV